MNESRFNMWRAIVALAHADHKITSEEKDFILDKMKGGPMNAAQADIIRQDLTQSRQVGDFMPLITAPEDRSTVVYYARMLVWSDGEYDQQEEKLVELLRRNALDQVDLDKELADAGMYAKRYAQEYEETRRMEKDRFLGNGLFRWISDFIDRDQG